MATVVVAVLVVACSIGCALSDACNSNARLVVSKPARVINVRPRLFCIRLVKADGAGPSGRTV